MHKTVSDHSNVVTLHRVIHDQSHIFIVMDFCPSGDLWRAVRAGIYWKNDALVRRVLLQLVDALQSCHRQGIYHRDLKPNNILVNDDGTEVFLTDFGLASRGQKSTSFGVGTCQFRSPGKSLFYFTVSRRLTRAECNNDARNYSFFDAERNDIWALGVIFANVLSGKLPWGRASEEDENYVRHVRHPHYLRHIMPISPEANYILQRIFHPSVEFTPSLDDVREMLLAVRTFFMDDKEMRGNARLQRIAEGFRMDSPLPSSDSDDSEELTSSLDDYDNSLLDDSDDSDEHSIGLHSPSLLALEEGRLNRSGSGVGMLLAEGANTSLLATPLVGGVEVVQSPLFTPSPSRLTPEDAGKATSSATLVTSDQPLVVGKGAWVKLSRSVKRVFGGSNKTQAITA